MAGAEFYVALDKVGATMSSSSRLKFKTSIFEAYVLPLLDVNEEELWYQQQCVSIKVGDASDKGLNYVSMTIEKGRSGMCKLGEGVWCHFAARKKLNVGDTVGLAYDTNNEMLVITYYSPSLGLDPTE